MILSTCRPAMGRGCRGQSLVEYLMVAMALIVVVLALAPRIQTAARNVMARALAQGVSPSATADTLIPTL